MTIMNIDDIAEKLEDQPAEIKAGQFSSQSF